MEHQLVAEIDGETVAFALVKPGGAPMLERVRRLRIDAFPTFTDALQSYLRENGASTAGLAMGLAVAGVSRGDVISLPNSRWFISVSGLKAFLGKPPHIINDFAATAWTVATLDASRLTRIGPGSSAAARRGTYLVVGTGPGLGMATLRIDESGGTTVLESEGGHASFAPQNEQEGVLLSALRRRHGGHVSFERLLSRPGLLALHESLPRGPGQPVPSATSVELIVAAAARGDPAARETMDVFLRIFGSFIGNAVLTIGGWDGVFLVGPMLETILPLMERGPLRAGMVAKGRMGRALEGVPVQFAHSENGSLAGVAAALRAREGLGSTLAVATPAPVQARPYAESKAGAFL